MDVLTLQQSRCIVSRMQFTWKKSRDKIVESFTNRLDSISVDHTHFIQAISGLGGRDFVLMLRRDSENESSGGRRGQE